MNADVPHWLDVNDMNRNVHQEARSEIYSSSLEDRMKLESVRKSITDSLVEEADDLLSGHGQKLILCPLYDDHLSYSSATATTDFASSSSSEYKSSEIESTERANNNQFLEASQDNEQLKDPKPLMTSYFQSYFSKPKKAMKKCMSVGYQDLRSMGWKEGIGVGCRTKRFLDIREDDDGDNYNIEEEEEEEEEEEMYYLQRKNPLATKSDLFSFYEKFQKGGDLKPNGLHSYQYFLQNQHKARYGLGYNANSFNIQDKYDSYGMLLSSTYRSGPISQQNNANNTKAIHTFDKYDDEDYDFDYEPVFMNEIATKVPDDSDSDRERRRKDSITGYQDDDSTSPPINKGGRKRKKNETEMDDAKEKERAIRKKKVFQRNDDTFFHIKFDREKLPYEKIADTVAGEIKVDAIETLSQYFSDIDNKYGNKDGRRLMKYYQRKFLFHGEVPYKYSELHEKERTASSQITPVPYKKADTGALSNGRARAKEVFPSTYIKQLPFQPPMAPTKSNVESNFSPEKFSIESNEDTPDRENHDPQESSDLTFSAMDFIRQALNGDYDDDTNDRTTNGKAIIMNDKDKDADGDKDGDKNGRDGSKVGDEGEDKDRDIDGNKELRNSNRSCAPHHVPSSLQAPSPPKTKTQSVLLSDFVEFDEDAHNKEKDTKPSKGKGEGVPHIRTTEVWFPSPLLCKRLHLPKPKNGSLHLQEVDKERRNQISSNFRSIVEVENEVMKNLSKSLNERHSRLTSVEQQSQQQQQPKIRLLGSEDTFDYGKRPESSFLENLFNKSDIPTSALRSEQELTEYRQKKMISLFERRLERERAKEERTRKAKAKDTEKDTVGGEEGARGREDGTKMKKAQSQSRGKKVIKENKIVDMIINDDGNDASSQSSTFGSTFHASKKLCSSRDRSRNSIENTSESEEEGSSLSVMSNETDEEKEKRREKEKRKEKKKQNEKAKKKRKQKERYKDRGKRRKDRKEKTEKKKKKEGKEDKKKSKD